MTRFLAPSSIAVTRIRSAPIGASVSHQCAIEATVHHHGTGFVVTGWLRLPSSTQGFRPALIVDGRPLAGSFQYLARPDLPTEPSTQAIGFEFTLAPGEAARLLDGPVTLVVGDGRGGAVSERRLSPPRWAWQIETLGDRAATGWAVDLIRPDLPAVLLLRIGRHLVPVTGGLPRPDVELAPGVAARSFTIDLRGLPGSHDGADESSGNDAGPDAGWVELCVGDALNPVASLRRPPADGRRPALAALVECRASNHRAALDGLTGLEAKLTQIRSLPRRELTRGFEPAARSKALRDGGLERTNDERDRRDPALWQPRAERRAVPGVATRAATGNQRDVAPCRAPWLDPDAGRWVGTGRESLAVVCAAGLSVAPALAARARTLAAQPDNYDAWYVPNGIRDLPRVRPAKGSRPGAGLDRETRSAFPFLKPRLTDRLLAQAPDYAPLLLAPAEALDGWRPADGMAALHARLLERLGPPRPLHEVLYAAAGRPAVQQPAAPAAHGRRRQPLVSLVVPSRDNVGHLAKLLAGIARLRQRGDNLELVIVDNASRSDTTAAFLDWAKTPWIRVARDRGGFNFSRLCNLGARRARGSVLLFCNDDIEIGGDFDLAAMIAPLREPDVGIVGHTLVYDDGTIQHAGVVVGAYDAADNGQTAFTLAEGGYFGLALATREVSAVTGAFMAVRRTVFHQLGGFNERDFAVNFNDVDLCLRARAEGLTVLNTCCGTVVHHESVSRAGAPDRRERELAEVATLRRIWHTQYFVDPYYSPGFDRFALPYTRPRWLDIGLAAGTARAPVAAPVRSRLAPLPEFAVS